MMHNDAAMARIEELEAEVARLRTLNAEHWRDRAIAAEKRLKPARCGCAPPLVVCALCGEELSPEPEQTEVPGG